MMLPSEWEYWKECWPDALCNVLRDFMASGNMSGVSGLSSFAVCHRGTVTTAYECTITALIRLILEGLEEAETRKKELVDKELDLKAMGVYESRKKVADLLEQGMVPVARLDSEVEGYRRKAYEICTVLRDAGFIRIEEQQFGRGKSRWIGLNAKWDGLMDDIKSKGTSKFLWASSIGIIICMAVTRQGIMTVQPMYFSVLEAGRKNGELSYKELFAHFAPVSQGKKKLDMILERGREKIDSLKIWSTDFGGRLLVNPSAVYAVKAWQRETNRLARLRGLGVAP
jgi:hypothetical protein